ncbi:MULTISPECIES: hypothetical protein [Citromicrobium]|uniref:hypothetical protein n=1 Tax=Citromicrobium TaxID=72173 RepID=UPI00058BCE89|nr:MULTISPECIES: hypothetical protein [Citromicrobium]ALG60762.1 hypothetical protein WG74_07940 [Citromicrobium sp. JL477]
MTSDAKSIGKAAIGRMRNAAGSATIPPECGSIVAIKIIDDRMFMLSQRCLTSGVFADHIDPDRTNPNLPQIIQQKELEFGADHHFVRKTAGAAFELADATYLPETVPPDALLRMSLEVSSSMASVVEVANDLSSHQDQMREASKAQKLSAAYVPRTPNLKGKVRQSLAALRDVEIAIKGLTTLFFPKDSNNEPWDAKFLQAMTEKHGENAELDAWKNAAWEVLAGVANHRHAMIHPNENKCVIIRDYELQADGSLLAPTIEITHEASAVTRRDVVQFLETQVGDLAEVFEAILGYVCDLKVRTVIPQFESHVVALPNGETQRGSHMVWRTIAKEGAPFGGPKANAD